MVFIFMQYFGEVVRRKQSPILIDFCFQGFSLIFLFANLKSFLNVVGSWSLLNWNKIFRTFKFVDINLHKIINIPTFYRFIKIYFWEIKEIDLFRNKMKNWFFFLGECFLLTSMLVAAEKANFTGFQVDTSFR